jgi:flavorubredoxin
MPAIESLKTIAEDFKFKIIDYVAIKSKCTPEHLKKCEELGEKLVKAILEKET